MTSRACIVIEAREWLDTPWAHQASRKGVGTDCAGLVIGVARACDVPNAAAFDADPRFKGYGRQPVAKTLLLACDEYLDRVSVHAATLGDILLLRWPRVPDPMHFAIVTNLDPPRVVHALATIGRVVEHGLDDEWRLRIMRAYRYRGLPD